jgi:hypothetical protein
MTPTTPRPALLVAKPAALAAASNTMAWLKNTVPRSLGLLAMNSIQWLEGPKASAVTAKSVSSEHPGMPER